jgi:hypothetical protein
MKKILSMVLTLTLFPFVAFADEPLSQKGLQQLADGLRKIGEVRLARTVEEFRTERVVLDIEEEEADEDDDRAMKQLEIRREKLQRLEEMLVLKILAAIKKQRETRVVRRVVWSQHGPFVRGASRYARTPPIRKLMVVNEPEEPEEIEELPIGE